MKKEQSESKSNNEQRSEELSAKVIEVQTDLKDLKSEMTQMRAQMTQMEGLGTKMREEMTRRSSVQSSFFILSLKY